MTDAVRLKESYDRDSDIAAILDCLARHHLGDPYVSADHIQERTDLSRQRVIRALKRLDELGAGSYVIGRRSMPTRLKLDDSAAEVVQAVVEGRISAPAMAGTPAATGPAMGRTLRHQFVLRPDLTVHIDVPENLTVREAERLSQFVDSLSFEDTD